MAKVIPNIVKYDEVDSTISVATNEIKEGRGEGLVVVAKKQTAGRGRNGKSFFSPDGCGIYLAIALNAKEFQSNILLVTSAASVAVRRAILKICKINCDIKWINDIYIKGKKVCGILCTKVLDNQGNDFVVVGIGINFNLNQDEFPDELKATATSIYNGQRQNSENIKMQCLINEVISQMYAVILELEGRKFLDEYRKNSCVIGKKIIVISNDKNLEAQALDIDDDCGLVIQFADGALKTLNSGEISIRCV